MIHLRRFLKATLTFGVWLGLLLFPHSVLALSYTEGNTWAWVYWSVGNGGVENTLIQSSSLELPDMMLTSSIKGLQENEALAKAWASLSFAGVGVYASGVTPETFPASGNAVATMYDTLNFTIPAGTYENDMIATVNGNVSGFFSATGGGNSFADFAAGFGPGISISRHWDDEGGAVSEDYLLSYTLVNAGSSLLEPFVLSVPIYQTLRGYATSSNGSISSAEADFFTSAQFLSLNVPPGITWTSDSGVFLSQTPNTVPEPGTLFLLGSGLIGLWGLRRKF